MALSFHALTLKTSESFVHTQENTMGLILLIVVLFLVFGGGGYYGFRRWR